MGTIMEDAQKVLERELPTQVILRNDIEDDPAIMLEPKKNYQVRLDCSEFMGWIAVGECVNPREALIRAIALFEIPNFKSTEFHLTIDEL